MRHSRLSAVRGNVIGDRSKLCEYFGLPQRESRILPFIVERNDEVLNLSVGNNDTLLLSDVTGNLNSPRLPRVARPRTGPSCGPKC